MTTTAFCLLQLTAFTAGFFTGINLRGNPPKRTRKTRSKSTPEMGQSENK